LWQFGKPPICAAMDKSIVEYLLSFGANVHAKDEEDG
jgi:hypothetical protein